LAAGFFRARLADVKAGLHNPGYAGLQPPFPKVRLRFGCGGGRRSSLSPRRRAASEEAYVSNEERCRGAAARYRNLRKLTKDPDTRRAYGELERLWLEMAAVAEEFDIDRACPSPRDDQGGRDLPPQAGLGSHAAITASLQLQCS
jgi:hypothetical protein